MRTSTSVTYLAQEHCSGKPIRCIRRSCCMSCSSVILAKIIRHFVTGLTLRSVPTSPAPRLATAIYRLRTCFGPPRVTFQGLASIGSVPTGKMGHLSQHTNYSLDFRTARRSLGAIESPKLVETEVDSWRIERMARPPPIGLGCFARENGGHHPKFMEYINHCQ